MFGFFWLHYVTATKFEASMMYFQVDAQAHDGLTALGFAAAAGHLDIVTMLSQHRAKVAPASLLATCSVSKDLLVVCLITVTVCTGTDLIISLQFNTIRNVI